MILGFLDLLNTSCHMMLGVLDFVGKIAEHS